MNLGESLLAIGAMALLSVLVLGVNNKIFFTGTSLTESKIEVLANSIGTSVIEEASSKAFDEATIANSVDDVSSLTDKNLMGAEGKETQLDFDDFDDYNGFKFADTKTLEPDTFYVSCKVFYVEPPDLELSSGKSWNKRIVVTVTSPYMPKDTITLTSIYSYWYFR